MFQFFFVFWRLRYYSFIFLPPAKVWVLLRLHYITTVSACLCSDTIIPVPMTLICNWLRRWRCRADSESRAQSAQFVGEKGSFPPHSFLALWETHNSNFFWLFFCHCGWRLFWSDIFPVTHKPRFRLLRGLFVDTSVAHIVAGVCACVWWIVLPCGPVPVFWIRLIETKPPKCWDFFTCSLPAHCCGRSCGLCWPNVYLCF